MVPLLCQGMKSLLKKSPNEWEIWYCGVETSQVSRLAAICEAFPLESSVLGPAPCAAESPSGCTAAAATKTQKPLCLYTYLQSVHLGERAKPVKSRSQVPETLSAFISLSDALYKPAVTGIVNCPCPAKEHAVL